MFDLLNNETVQITLLLGFALLVGWWRGASLDADNQDGAEANADGFVERRHRTNERLRQLTLAMYRDRHCAYPMTTAPRMRRHDDTLPSSAAEDAAPATSVRHATLWQGTVNRRSGRKPRPQAARKTCLPR